MIFIILFIIGALAFPLLVEVYRCGNNNIVSRSGKEILDSKLVTVCAAKLNRILNSIGSFASGTVVIVFLLVIGSAVFYALKVILRVVVNVVGNF